MHSMQNTLDGQQDHAPAYVRRSDDNGDAGGTESDAGILAQQGVRVHGDALSDQHKAQSQTAYKDTAYSNAEAAHSHPIPSPITIDVAKANSNADNTPQRPAANDKDSWKSDRDALSERIARRVKRADRVESSWEDVISDSSEEEESQDGGDTARSMATTKQTLASTSRLSKSNRNVDQDDPWEDEESSDDLESDSGLSSATEAALATANTHRRKGSSVLSETTDDETIRSNATVSTPQKSDRLPRRNSAQRALREYRQSKLALMQTENDNVERLSRIMRGEPDISVNGHATEQAYDSTSNETPSNGASTPVPPERLEIRRTDTLDLLTNTEPFTASIRTEFFDEAAGAGRASEIHLSPDVGDRSTVSQPTDSNNGPSTPSAASGAKRLSNSSQSRRTSAIANPRSPRLPPRRLSSSPSNKTIHLPPIATDASQTSTSNGLAVPQRERYASDPNTPVELEAPASEAWPDVTMPSTELAKDTLSKSIEPQSTPKTAIPIHVKSELETPRRSNRMQAAHAEQTLYTPNAATSASTLQPPPSASGKHHYATAKRESAPSPDAIQAQLDRLAEATPPFSLWDYLREEIMASDFDSTQEMKWERVTNFIAIPFWMEKIMLFGFFVCLDSFLYTFTILPLRFLVAVFVAIRNQIVWLAGGPRRYLSSSHKCDILKAVLIMMSCFILSQITDASQMYHSVRGQDVVKLYVIFNVLEIADRLCCSFGQDLLDSLFSRSTLARRKDGKQPYLRPLGFFTLSLLYVLAHTLVLLYQLVTLNVAINSYDNALLTLLLSNQFVEIKGSVFKKFEKENLFQLTCADIVERFQLTLMLCSIGMRNLIEVAGAAGNSVSSSSQSSGNAISQSQVAPEQISGPVPKPASALSAIAMLGPLPTSFTVFPSFSLLETIFTPVCIVLASEYLVDWLKHAFITKFNHIRPSVYGRFMDVLCRDLILVGPVRSNSRRRNTFVDQSPVVSRRLGFAAVPLACLLVRMTSQVWGMLHDDSHYDECSVPDLHKHSSANETGLDSTLRSFLIEAYRRPFIALLRPLSHDPNKALDIVLHYIWSTSTWILTITIAWVFLVGVKLLLGTNLSHFAAKRFATMAQREKEEELNARGRQPIGVDQEEMAYDAKIAQLVDRGEDDALRVGLNGAPLPAPTKNHQGSGSSNSKGNKDKMHADSLMDVSRYTMVRSRIW